MTPVVPFQELVRFAIRRKGTAYPVMALQHNVLGTVPVTILHCRLQIRAMVSVKIRENAVLILQTAIAANGGGVFLDSREGAGSRALDPERPGGKVGEGGRRGSRRSRYHGDSWGPMGEEIGGRGRRGGRRGNLGI